METIVYGLVTDADIDHGFGMREARLQDGRVVLLPQFHLGALYSHRYASCALAMQAARGRRLVVSTLTGVDTTLSTPVDVELGIPKGCGFVVASGKTLTINSPVSAGRYQIFSGDGTVSIASGAVDKVNAAWFGAIGDEQQYESAALQRAIDATPENGVLYIPDGVYRLDDTVIVDKTMTIEAAGAEFTAEGCSAWQFGDEASSCHYSTIHFRAVRGLSGTYVNSGLIFENCSLATVSLQELQFFEQGLDFNAYSTLAAGVNAAGENRLVGGTIQRCYYGARFRHSGAGSEFVDPTERGWVEGNVIDMSIFGCTRGVYIEADALATYTQVLRVIDCAQDHTGATSATSLDIECLIENGIVANVNYLRDTKYTLANAITHKISGWPYDNKYNYQMPNLLYNGNFKIPRATVANPYVNVNINDVTLTVNADSSVRMTPSAADPYLQVGAVGLANVLTAATENMAIGGSYLTAYASVRQQGGSAADALVQLDLIVTDGGTVVRESRAINITNTVGVFTDVRYTWLLTATTTAVQSLRVRAPNGTSVLDIGEMRLWRGFGPMPPQWPRQNGPFEGFAYAAPTISAWAVGDTMWNIVPTVGQPIGWKCTVAGTPGTFVAMANL